MRAILGTIVVLASASCWAQKKSLDVFVNEQRTSIAGNSSLIYIDGQKVMSQTMTLAGFRRKLVTFGKLKAIVPETMIQIDDSFTQKPNLYDGLDQRSKVLYFISTLNESQVKTATSAGIGFGDLSSDQRLVLNSILPKKLTVERKEADSKESRVVDKFTLSNDQRLKVRFKLSKSVSFDLNLADNSRGYVQADSMDSMGLTNTSGFFRVREDQDTGADEIFGVKVRSVVPNKLKLSDIDYNGSNLDPLIKFSAPVSLNDAFQQVKARTGVTIYADPRVGNRKLTFSGEAVKVRELLPAIAQAVTGTYRRVGSDFVLTSDLTGLGSRKLRFDLWEADVRNQIEKKKGTWFKQIAATNILKLVKRSSSDPIQGNSQFDEYLDKYDRDGARLPIPENQLDSSMQSLVQRHNNVYTTQLATINGACAKSNLRFNFVMPSGQEILDMNEGDLVETWVINWSLREQPKQNYPSAKPLRKIPEKATVGLAVRASNKSDVEKLVPFINNLGFKEIWLETDSSDVLTTAITLAKPLGIQVRLTIRPWTNLDFNQESDCTILGDTSSAVKAWVPKNERLSPPMMKYDLMRQRTYSEDSLSPDNFPERWSLLKRLTQTSGIAGIAVMDAQPKGYEPKQGEGYSTMTSPSEMAPFALGYATSMRSKFLRKFSVDPIDLVPRGLFSQVNTNPYFFTDMELMGYPRTYGSGNGEEFVIEPYGERWRDFRREVMADAKKRLSNSLLLETKIPIWSDLLVSTSNKYQGIMIPMTAYVQDKGFTYDPTGPGAPFGAGMIEAASVRVMIDGIADEVMQMMLVNLLNTVTISNKIPFIFDCSTMSVSDIEKILAKWLDPRV